MADWRLEHIPDQSDRVAIVTGGNVGLGFASARELARAGARVVIACRDVAKGESAADRIRADFPNADTSAIALDLVDPESIDRFADTFAKRFDRLDVLLNNAGVVNLEHLTRDARGFEMHMATNHLGHFALTGRLFPLIAGTPGARVVTVSSMGYRVGAIDFDDLDWSTRPYDRVKSYGDSKLANLLFTLQLERALRASGSSAMSVAAHPGLTGTERQQSIGVGGAFTRWLAAPVEKGVRSQLRAATDPEVVGAAFYGPRFQVLGRAVRLRSIESLVDIAPAEELWGVSEERTGVAYPG